MDGENNGKPYEQMDDLGGKHPYFWVDTHMCVCIISSTPKNQNYESRETNPRSEHFVENTGAIEEITSKKKRVAWWRGWLMFTWGWKIED